MSTGNCRNGLQHEFHQLCAPATMTTACKMGLCDESLLSGGVLKRLSYPCLLILFLTSGAGATAQAEDATDPVVVAAAPVLTSHGLLSQLEGFLRQRGIEAGQLTADAVVGVMRDWMRFSPIDAGGAGGTADELVYQYGGWSEGCATGFKLSLLRKVSGAAAGGESGALTVGITLLFDPGANTRFAPYRLASSEANSIEDFMAGIERSPAYQKLAAETPMSAFIERGGMR